LSLPSLNIKLIEPAESNYLFRKPGNFSQFSFLIVYN